MFCMKCGARNDDGARFCVSCGAPMAGDAPVAGGAPAWQQNGEVPKTKTRNKAVDFAVLIAVIVIVYIVFHALGVSAGQMIADLIG